MNWNQQLDFTYIGSGTPYTAGGFMDFFEGLTYDHVNFIFAGALHMQDCAYPSLNLGYYKFGYSEPGITEFYDEGYPYDGYDHTDATNEYRRPVDVSSNITNDLRTTSTQQSSEEAPNTQRQTSNRECPRSNQNTQDHQVIWQDSVDPDNMTYEELLELGEAVGTQSRGLSPEQISLLPVSKFKSHFFLRKKSRSERCVICQMEYRRGDRVLTLPCKHKYHADCGTKWLSINKACPICYTDVRVDGANK